MNDKKIDTLVATKDEHAIRTMFDSAAEKYDLLNSLMTLGMDNCWRKQTIKKLKQHLKNTIIDTNSHPPVILDLATGTGDFIIEIKKIFPSAAIMGVDISRSMLEIASMKIASLSHVHLCKDSASELSFGENTFDAITIGFGVRNFQNLRQCIHECYRVLKSNGCLLILEATIPQNKLFRFLYLLYAKSILPLLGRFFSQVPYAYNYFTKSVEHFSQGNEFINILTSCGFQDASFRFHTMQTVVIYYAKKPI